MRSIPRESLSNLEDLRLELANSLCVIIIITGGLLAYEALLQDNFPYTAFIFYLVLIITAINVYRISKKWINLGRRLLVGILTVCLLAAMWLLPAPELPYLGILLTFVAAVLINEGEWVVPILVGGCAIWWTQMGWRPYSLGYLLISLTMGGIIAHLIFSTIHTALKWAWNAQIQAGQLLDQARNHRAELSRSLKSLELTNLVQRRLHNELITAKNEANAARQMKERFAANISHELRTPLNLILGFSDIMFYTPEAYGEFSWPQKLRRDIYQIHRSSKHLLEMIDDILDLSRYDMVDFTLHMELTPLDMLIKNTYEITSGLFDDPNVKLEIILPQDLPKIEVDRTRIRQVIINLINNARRFTVKGFVRVEAYQNEKEVVISVEDSGPGISEKELDNIFNEFYQVDFSIRRKEQGFGLGLAICERFVKAHKGKIWVESQVGVGSKFLFSIPKTKTVMSNTYNPINYPVDDLLKRSKILVVDPDPAVVNLVGRHLEDLDFIQVEKLEQLSEQITFHHPRAVIVNKESSQLSSLSDMDLPVPVIECSLPSQSWMANDLHVAAVMTKPITYEKLLNEINKLEGMRDILVIDDNLEFIQLVKRILESSNLNFNIRHACDGIRGLAALYESKPDLVLLDLIMPEMDGSQFLQKMQQDEQFKNINIIIVTATSYQSYSNVASTGYLAVKQKLPLSVSEILACIQAILGIIKPQYTD